VQKVDWLAACIAQRVVGAVWVVFLWSWRKICTILQPMGSNGPYLKKCPKPCWPIWSKEARKYTFLYKIIGATKKNWAGPLFRPRTDQACPQKRNPSRETVPLNIFLNIFFRSKNLPLFSQYSLKWKIGEDLLHPVWLLIRNIFIQVQQYFAILPFARWKFL
jgi:hypothetical protein